ncbi:hypothetical protein HAT2_00674 [Candidatus Similichlamydia laticola]|uniref:Uncharacterized protein n=1 Tax=Candidatus Similichlamydia laticola TaxID=2170265 RepID=A0A369KHF6_9BACT|nr:hypothetical protein HAT2_00674 [Candidatus Similichlamydia laticola]
MQSGREEIHKIHLHLSKRNSSHCIVSHRITCFARMDVMASTKSRKRS